MRNLKFRIGTKMAISSGLGLLLVVGLVVNQMIGNGAIARSNAVATLQESITANSIDAKASIRGMMTSLRDVRLARSPEEVQKGIESLRARFKSASEFVERLLQDVRAVENRERLQKVKGLVEAYSKLADELAAARNNQFDLYKKRAAIGGLWGNAYSALAKSPVLAGRADQQSLDVMLHDADGAFMAARNAAWRLAATGERDQLQRSAKNADRAAELLKKIRAASTDKTVLAGIDEMLPFISSFNQVVSDISKSQELETSIAQTRALPVATEAGELIDKVVATAKAAAKQAVYGAAAEMTSMENIELGVALLVAVMLIGSALFSVVTIARPISKIGEVLMELANGNKTVEVPYAERGDEVGDNARAAKTFKDNLLRIEKMETEQKEAEQRAVAQRKADMHTLANEFETAIGNIVDTVSSASTELEAAATTLTHTAETTQQLSTAVAAASEEASTNVNSVASATEEMASSVSEIARQVQDSSNIANEPVKQAEKTDTRIAQLAHAAQQIGEVVSLITTIAEQTNLLALNATIEAARAGEAGRGFAVVAQEVKALAAQTAKATGEIGTQVAGIQSATQDSVAAIKDISQTIGRISEIASTIAAAVEEQGAATQEISRNVQQAARGTAEVASNITDVNKGASETGSASSQVLSSAQSLSSEGARLKVEVGKFLDTVRAA